MNRSQQTCVVILMNRNNIQHTKNISFSQIRLSRGDKQVTESPVNNQLSSSFNKEKAKDSVKTGGYGLFLIGGVGLLVVVFGTIFKVDICVL